MTLLAELGAQQGHADERGVLVAVADDEAAHLALQGQAGEQLRFAAHFQAEIERLAGIQDFLHHLAQLVDLDREHAPVTALVIELGDGVAEGGVDGLHPVPQDVLKPDQHRKLQAARFGFLHDIGDIDRGAIFLQGFGDDAPRLVDVEVARAPALDVVQIASLLDVPALTHIVELLISMLQNRGAL